MGNNELTARFWDSAWGEIDDYAFADDLTELGSIKIGDPVICTVEEANDPTNPSFVSAFEDDEGTVLGFSTPREGGGPFNLPATGNHLYVTFEGNDPVIVDCGDVELLTEDM